MALHSNFKNYLEKFDIISLTETHTTTLKTGSKKTQAERSETLRRFVENVCKRRGDI